MKNKLVYLSGSMALLLALLLASILFTSMDASFYQREHQKYNTAASSGLNFNQLDEAMRLLLGYIDGSIESLERQMTDQRNGTEFELFNAREKSHMLDVRALYDVAYNTMIISAMVASACLLYGFITKKKLALLGFAYYYNRVSIAFFIMLFMILFLAMTNFDFFWTNFHQLVFSNDLWLLNPVTDRLITIVYEEIFFDLVLKIGITFLLVFLVLNAGAYFIQRRYRKQFKEIVQ